MMGPYETEAEARNEPMPQEIHRLHTEGVITSGDPQHVEGKTMVGHLMRACQDAGVRTGAYDRHILAWLCGWEPETVQVIIGIISRANNGRNR